MEATNYKKVFIKSEADLPKESGIYFVNEYDENNIRYFHPKDLYAQKAWIGCVEWYLQPISQPEKDLLTLSMRRSNEQDLLPILMSPAKETLLLKVIDRYQQFTKWVIRHTPEIKESERGLNMLNDIDWAEHKVKEYEAVHPSTEQSVEITDEEIDDAAFNHDNAWDETFYEAWKEGAKWMRDKMKSRDTCTCNSDNYGYGFAKCYDCGKMKPDTITTHDLNEIDESRENKL